MDFSNTTWAQPNDFIALTKLLHSLSEQDYQAFNAKIAKTNWPVLGVRMPKLKTIAKSIAGGHYQNFLKNFKENCHEDFLLRALVTAYAPLPYEEFLHYCRQLTSLIDNWAVCDTFCSAVSLCENADEFFSELSSYLQSENPWFIRLALVMMLDHYLTPPYFEEVLVRCIGVACDHYYVKMAQAWLLSIAYVQNPTGVYSFLKTEPIDPWILRKTISKICDSYRVTQENKEKVKALRKTLSVLTKS